MTSNTPLIDRIAARQSRPEPIIERRDDVQVREPRWQTWTREHGAGKDLSGRVAA
jgi:hypothetical protein